MLWIILAFLCGVFAAAHGAIGKRIVETKGYILATWAASITSLPFLIGHVLWRSETPPSPQPVVLLYLLGAVGLLLIANTLYFKAVSVGELSRDIPLLSLTPIFMILTSYLMVDQTLSFNGAAAILIVVAGCFILQQQKGRGITATFKALFTEPGSRLMLVVALIWSITANFDKLCLQQLGPYWYPPIINLLFAVCYTPVVLHARLPLKAMLRRLWLPLIAIGFVQALLNISQMLAVDVAPHVAYVITLKRGGLLIASLLLGAWIFKERHLGWRAIGAFWILGGLVLLASEAG